jgi:hypothetical protein
VVLGDDDVVLVDHDGLTEAKLLDGLGDGIHRCIRVPWVAIVRNDRFDGRESGFHGNWGELEEGKGGVLRVIRSSRVYRIFFPQTTNFVWFRDFIVCRPRVKLAGKTRQTEFTFLRKTLTLPFIHTKINVTQPPEYPAALSNCTA